MPYQNILLVDDDLDDLEIFYMALENVSNGLYFQALTNPVEALQKLSNKELHPDVIFLDLNMPVMKGQEFLARIKEIEHLRAIPVIIVSSHLDENTIEYVKNHGAEYFVKPSEINKLAEILKTYLNP